MIHSQMTHNVSSWFHNVSTWFGILCWHCLQLLTNHILTLRHSSAPTLYQANQYLSSSPLAPSWALRIILAFDRREGHLGMKASTAKMRMKKIRILTASMLMSESWQKIPAVPRCSSKKFLKSVPEKPRHLISAASRKIATAAWIFHHRAAALEVKQIGRQVWKSKGG